ncbi:MAG: hypothetical protein K9J13_09020 [Saprospiraceae bacterium]|nr:hypothetical protein [Saprospiraceae bacterium]
MGIDSKFSRELLRVQRVPQRALYRQTIKLSRGLDKSVVKGLKGKKVSGKQKFARELLWFFATILLSLSLALGIYYIIGQIIPETLYQLVIDIGSMVKFYYLLSLICFVGIYLVRIIIWAIKLLTVKSS